MDTDKSRNIFWIIFVVAVLFRLFFWVFAYFKLPISTDEAWVGLMSMHILKGEFPVFYWGQAYMGTQESFIDAPLIYLFGANAPVIRIYPFVFSLLFVIVSYRLAKKIYNDEVGIITLLLLVIPVPYLTMCSAVIPPDNCIVTAMLGSLALLLTYDIVFTGENRAGVFAFLGLVLGYGFYNHILIASYIGVVFLFLFLKDKLIVFRKNFWVFLICFAFGSLPLICYNLMHSFATFRDVAYSADFRGFVENIKTLFGLTLHFLIGMKVMLYGDNTNYISLPKVLSVFLGLTAVILILIVTASRFKKMWRICVFSVKNVDGTVMLLITAAAVIFTFSRSGRSNWWAVRYMLPMMSVLPILFAAGLSEIKKYTKAGFYSIVLVILFSQGLGNFYLAKAWNDPLLVSEKLDLPDTKPLMKFLNEHNIKHAYAHFWISYRLTYETKEGVICSTPYNERYAAYKVPFIDEVKKSDNVAYILHNKLGLKEEYFEACMKEIGGSYKKQVIDELPEQTGKVPTGFVVYYDFEAPYKKVPLKEVARDNWRVSSNCNDKESSKATDGDINTRWGSACPQRPDIWFMIDLGGFHKIGKLCFEFGQYGTDFPHGYRVEVSEDGEKWKTVSDMPHAGGGLYWRGSHPVCFANGNTLTAAFPTIDARYVKIVQTGAHPIYDWSIAEVRVYEV